VTNKPTPPSTPADTMSGASKSLLTFPCDFTLKVFGAESDAFEKTILAVICKQLSTYTEQSIPFKKNTHGKYCAYSITLHVESQAELDNVYRALTSLPEVLMVL
jgi:putative lipoic acid-binding regulatory protein